MEHDGHAHDGRNENSLPHQTEPEACGSYPDAHSADQECRQVDDDEDQIAKGDEPKLVETSNGAAPVDSDGLAVQSCNLEYLWKVHDYVNNYIRFADAKAGAILAFSVAMIGALFSAKMHAGFTATSPGNWGLPEMLSVVAFGSLAISVFVAAGAIKPRLLNTKQDPGFVFWENILAHKEPQVFWDAYAPQGQPDLEKNLAYHLFDLCRVCRSKYLWVAISLWAGLVGGFLGAMLILLR